MKLKVTKWIGTFVTILKSDGSLFMVPLSFIFISGKENQLRVLIDSDAGLNSSFSVKRICSILIFQSCKLCEILKILDLCCHTIFML